MSRLMLGIICVLVAAPAIPGDAFAAELKAADIAGRWQGESWAQGSGGSLTLDIVACGKGWCGIRVAANDSCAGTALKVNTGTVAENNAQFEGTLELAPGTEPYTVHATIFPPEEGKPLALQISGDTGGQFRAYRRSFPFEAQLARMGDVRLSCAADRLAGPVSGPRHCLPWALRATIRSYEHPAHLRQRPHHGCRAGRRRERGGLRLP